VSVKAKPPDKTTLRIKAVCLLREFGGESFDIIDRILGLEPGIARKTYEYHKDAYQGWTKKFAAEALQRFYKDQITVLQILSKSAPTAVKMWADILESPTAKPADREKAAKGILEWTKLYISSKEKAGVREMIPQALLEVHDEAEEMGGYLQKMLGSALDLDREESN